MSGTPPDTTNVTVTGIYVNVARTRDVNVSSGTRDVNVSDTHDVTVSGTRDVNVSGIRDVIVPGTRDVIVSETRDSSSVDPSASAYHGGVCAMNMINSETFLDKKRNDVSLRINRDCAQTDLHLGACVTGTETGISVSGMSGDVTDVKLQRFGSPIPEYQTVVRQPSWDMAKRIKLQTPVLQSKKSEVKRSDDAQTRISSHSIRSISPLDIGAYGRPLQTTDHDPDTVTSTTYDGVPAIGDIHRTDHLVLKRCSPERRRSLNPGNLRKLKISVKWNCRKYFLQRWRKMLFTCEICGESFHYRYKSILHLRKHRGEGHNTRNVCAKSSALHDKLRVDMLTNIGVKPYNCGICHKGFTQSRYLRRHVFTHTGEKPHACDICGKCFGRRYHLKLHVLTHTGEKPHTCDICGKGFARQYHLKIHMLTHTGEKTHTCDICSKGFARRGDLKAHMLTHTGEKPHTCEICLKGFARRNQFKEHMTIHTDEKPFSCDICHKRFTRQRNVNKHMVMHTVEKLHACPICNTGFPRRNDLKKHMFAHRDEKPHTCDICLKGFARRNQLKEHKTTHTDEKPYSCDICHKRFTRQRNVTKHMVMHTSEINQIWEIVE